MSKSLDLVKDRAIKIEMESELHIKEETLDLDDASCGDEENVENSHEYNNMTEYPNELHIKEENTDSENESCGYDEEASNSDEDNEMLSNDIELHIKREYMDSNDESDGYEEGADNDEERLEVPNEVYIKTEINADADRQSRSSRNSRNNVKKMVRGKEDMNRFRQKLRENGPKWEEHKKKERERIKKFRQKVKNYPENQAKKVTTVEQKKKKAERMRQYRATLKYKIEHPEANRLPCKTKQSLFKAVNRVRKVLPECIDRKRIVLKQLCEEFYPEISSEISKKENEIKNDYKKVRAEKVYNAKVVNFYQRDDISYQTPGVSDVKSVKTGMTKVLMQKRYMIMTLKEAYEIYSNETEISERVGKTKFFELRPQNIMLVADTPHNVCVCQLHVNFVNLCSALKNIHGFPSPYKSLLNKLCCNMASESCMMGKCVSCETDIKDVLPLLTDYNINIFWKQWGKSQQNGRIEEIKYNASIAKAVQELQAQLPKFKKHFFINNIQSAHFIKLKQNLNENEVVIQIDFAENFALFSQDEVQAAHFSHEQVTVFTACVWAKNKIQSIAIISNDLSHDKYCVWNFLKTILDYLKANIDKLKKCHIFSDGCASQFKNKFILSSLIMMESRFDMKITWSFFATSHGKGAVDGIGGTVKRTVWTQIKSRKKTIRNAKDFANCAAEKLNNVQIFYNNKENIVETRHLLSPIWEHTHLPKIPNLKLQHFLEVSHNRVLSRYTYKSNQFTTTEYINYT